METLDRRTFFRRGLAVGGGLAALSPLQALGAQVAHGANPGRSVGYGPLVNKGDLWLPEAFDYAVIQRQGEPMSDGNVVPGIFDGMAAYPGRRGTIVLIRNHENRRQAGEIDVIVPEDLRYDPTPSYNAGNTKVVLDAGPRRGSFEVLETFAVLGGTDTNCAGGTTPWRSWITCEEVVNRSEAGVKHGYVFDIPSDTTGPVKAEPIRAAGRFVHEASLFFGGAMYQTEDRTRSASNPAGAAFYRYLPDPPYGAKDPLWKTTGVLQALKLRDEPQANMDVGRVQGEPLPVEWITIDVADHDDDTDAGPLATRNQARAKGAAAFNREEGMWVGGKKVYFDVTNGGAAGQGQVWEYDPERAVLTLIYESPGSAVLQSPDNVVIVPKTGQILLQEDGAGEQFVRGVTRRGQIYDFARTAANETEFAGGCFDPNGQILFVNQQGDRGNVPAGPPDGGAVTYAIWGPWKAVA
jgi:secreted PhoX family phosphatase